MIITIIVIIITITSISDNDDNNFSKFTTVQWNYIHLMYGPEGNSFVFLRVLMFPETESRGTSGLEGNQN